MFYYSSDNTFGLVDRRFRIKMKHHYLPEFYMKKWACSEKRELQFYYIDDYNKVIRSRRMSPGARGYRHDLYARTDSNNVQRLEKNCYQQIDSNAANVMAKMLKGQKLSDEERHHFSNFIYSLLVRHLEQIERNFQISQGIIQKKKEGTPKEIREEPEYQNAVQSMEENHHLECMEALSTSGNPYDLKGQDGFAKIFCSFNWRIENFSKESFSLLSCDAPIIIGNEFGQNSIGSNNEMSLAAHLSTKKYLVLIPLSPTDCFLAFPREYGLYVENNVIKNRGSFVKKLNLMIVRKKKDEEGFVISKDRKQEAFICKHFGKDS